MTAMELQLARALRALLNEQVEADADFCAAHDCPPMPRTDVQNQARHALVDYDRARLARPTIDRYAERIDGAVVIA